MKVFGEIWLLIAFVIGVAFGRRVPYYDLDDDFYSDIRNILEDHLSSKVPPGFANHPREVRGWGLTIPRSQVAGVAVDPDGNPVIFHRGTRFWNYDTFNESNHIQHSDPIPESVVLTLNEVSGEVVRSWGAGTFFLPHGITIDARGNTWLTDVGAHQVYKFGPKKETPSLVLGQKLQPGSDKKHFCQPTSVAVASSGEFFVADGYCNARVIHFSPEGLWKAQYGSDVESEGAPLNVPHGLTLNEALNVLCIADRENGRVVCIRAGLAAAAGREPFGTHVNTIAEPNHIRVFDMAFVGNGLVGIAGSEEEGIALGFTANIEQGIVDQWEPIQGFHNPHCITVDEKRRTIYVAEVGPNRVWKFILDAATGEDQA